MLFEKLDKFYPNRSFLKRQKVAQSLFFEKVISKFSAQIILDWFTVQIPLACTRLGEMARMFLAWGKKRRNGLQRYSEIVKISLWETAQGEYQVVCCAAFHLPPKPRIKL